MRRLLLALAAFLALAGVPSLAAAQQVFDYRIVHPTWGDIGTYRNVVTQDGDRTTVQTQLHVLVKIIGITAFQQDGVRTEQWSKDRLVGIEATTNTNGETLQFHGAAQGDGFLVTTATGSSIAPANVHPSNPWSRMSLNSDMMMNTKTGYFYPVNVSNSGKQAVALGGSVRQLQQFDVVGPKHDIVWLDDSGTVAGFRIEQNGALIDFVLNPAAAPNNQLSAAPQ
jgi:hypothetical protein